MLHNFCQLYRFLYLYSKTSGFIPFCQICPCYSLFLECSFTEPRRATSHRLWLQNWNTELHWRFFFFFLSSNNFIRKKLFWDSHSDVLTISGIIIHKAVSRLLKREKENKQIQHFSSYKMQLKFNEGNLFTFIFRQLKIQWIP